MTGEILRWVLGPGAVRARATVDPQNLLQVRQQAFLPPGVRDPQHALLDAIGFIYVPRACQLRPGDSVAVGAGAVTPIYSARCQIHVHYRE